MVNRFEALQRANFRPLFSLPFRFSIRIFLLRPTLKVNTDDWKAIDQHEHSKNPKLQSPKAVLYCKRSRLASSAVGPCGQFSRFTPRFLDPLGCSAAVSIPISTADLDLYRDIFNTSLIETPSLRVPGDSGYTTAAHSCGPKVPSPVRRNQAEHSPDTSPLLLSLMEGDT